jgi:hypothetical protein
MSATPYELRAQLLQQAEKILMYRFQKEYDTIRENTHIALQKDASFDHTAVEYPTMPTTEDIIEEAKKLYNFVQTK